MSYPQCVDDGLHRAHDVAQIVCGDRLVDATPEATRELAESAMLLSQGARRAIEMISEADPDSAEGAAAASATAGETRRA
jgi:hypothetical protein